MTTTHRTNWARAPEARVLAVLVAVETLALAVYLAVATPRVSAPRYLLYPFLWINAGIVAVVHVSPPPASRRARLTAGAVAGAYFLALTLVTGLVGLEFVGAHSHAHISGLQVTMSAPGWGPRVGYAGSLLTLNFVPYRVVGYVALAYLVYARLLDVATAAAPGVVAVASCIGCSFSILGPAVGLLGAGGSGLVAAVVALSVDVSTVAFLLAVGLLARPGDWP